MKNGSGFVSNQEKGTNSEGSMQIVTYTQLDRQEREVEVRGNITPRDVFLPWSTTTTTILNSFTLALSLTGLGSLLSWCLLRRLDHCCRPQLITKMQAREGKAQRTQADTTYAVRTILMCLDLHLC